MRNPLNFFTELFAQPKAVVVWVSYLMVINMASLLFWEIEFSRIIFFTFLASSMLMMFLYSIFGFKKILGLGHILWAPLLAYIILHAMVSTGDFQKYLLVLGSSILISLIFDVIDIYKFLKDEALI